MCLSSLPSITEFSPMQVCGVKMEYIKNQDEDEDKHGENFTVLDA
jgi:hypothetical protein